MVRGICEITILVVFYHWVKSQYVNVHRDESIHSYCIVGSIHISNSDNRSVKNVKALFLEKKVLTFLTLSFYNFGEHANSSELPCSFDWIHYYYLSEKMQYRYIAVNSLPRDCCNSSKTNHQCK